MIFFPFNIKPELNVNVNNATDGIYFISLVIRIRFVIRNTDTDSIYENDISHSLAPNPNPDPDLDSRRLDSFNSLNRIFVGMAFT